MSAEAAEAVRSQLADGLQKQVGGHKSLIEAAAGRV
jgi:hypothetical protein